ncbi:discoidin domain-containing protein [Nonomuraea sp. NPDC050310]|uniref:discoidin domain-containing protein n=1 Tax=Nonomuraea sp. NPDC050310 TaxID=3154935 RepID=UPI0034102B38
MIRRLGVLAASTLLLALLTPAAHAAPTWTLRWSPNATTHTPAQAFETLEDDRADSHPAARPHIKVSGDAYRFDMHMVDRDSITDRQRQEVTGNRTPAGHLQWKLGETWRVTYSMYIPSTLKATTTFTHIMQTKQPGSGGSPITVTSLRRVNGVQTIEHKVFEQNILVGRTNLEPLHDKWIDIEYEMKIGNGTDGSVRWVVKSGGTTIVDATKTGVDTFLADRVRPKWGIYRSLGDTSGSLQDTYLLLRNLRAYQLTDGGGDTAAPSTPASLRVTGTTSSSVSLAWNASTDNVGVTGYEVFRGSTLVATVTGTTHTDTGLSPSTGYTYTVKALDAAGNRSAAGGPVTGTTAGTSTGTLLSQGKPAYASSIEGAGFEAGKAVDGDAATRWASLEGQDPQWLRVDLGSTAAITRVKLTWEAAYAKAYTIQTSPDASTWTTVHTTTNGDGGTDDLTLNANARHIRVHGTQRATPYGYSLHEFQVYGTAGSTPSPSPTSTGATTWRSGTVYAVNSQVVYGGVTYRCLQAHTAQAGWEPPAAPSLWQQL